MSDAIEVPPGFGEGDPEFIKGDYNKSKQETGGGGFAGVPMLYLKKGLTEVRILPPK